jgi:hypothetical protein
MANETRLPEIVSGIHTGEPISHLDGPDGQIISVWSTSPVDLLDAMTQAIGPVPHPPSLGLGGEVEKIYPINPFSNDPAQIIYNPAGDVINQQLMEGFKAQVSAWNARAQAIQATIQAIIQSQKGATAQRR